MGRGRAGPAQTPPLGAAIRVCSWRAITTRPPRCRRDSRSVERSPDEVAVVLALDRVLRVALAAVVRIGDVVGVGV